MAERGTSGYAKSVGPDHAPHRPGGPVQVSIQYASIRRISKRRVDRYPWWGTSIATPTQFRPGWVTRTVRKSTTKPYHLLVLLRSPDVESGGPKRVSTCYTTWKNC